MNPNRKVVLGLGNLLFQDEGLGIHALRILQSQLGALPGLEYVDGGVLGLNLLPLIEECSHLLVLDAIDAGFPVGTLVEIDGEQIPLFQRMKLSQHQVGFQEVLALARMRNLLPAYLHLIAIQPANLDVGIGLSPQVEDAIPQLYERACSLLERWGFKNVEITPV